MEAQIQIYFQFNFNFNISLIPFLPFQFWCCHFEYSDSIVQIQLSFSVMFELNKVANVFFFNHTIFLYTINYKKKYIRCVVLRSVFIENWVKSRKIWLTNSWTHPKLNEMGVDEDIQDFEKWAQSLGCPAKSLPGKKTLNR